MLHSLLLFLSFIVYSLQESLVVLSCSPGQNRETERIKVVSTVGRIPRDPLRAWSSFTTQSFCHSDGSPLRANITERAIFAFCNGCTEACPARKLRELELNKTSILLLSTDQKPDWLTDSSIAWAVVDRNVNLPATSECLVHEEPDALKSFSKTSVLFVSISFIILMVISLAWLVFYYVQRFRYAHAKDRLQRRLFNAAKKALSRMPARPLKTGDAELEGSVDCPVCIDLYAAGDIVRTLPCRHVFHKMCIDPWLLEHRTCPMCKADILKAFGYQVGSDTSRREGGGGGGERRPTSPEGTSDEVVVPPTHPQQHQRIRVVGEVHLPATTTAVLIERTRPVRENSWTGSSASSSSRPCSNHVVNLVHVRSRSASSGPRAAAFRPPSSHADNDEADDVIVEEPTVPLPAAPGETPSTAATQPLAPEPVSNPDPEVVVHRFV